MCSGASMVFCWMWPAPKTSQKYRALTHPRTDQKLKSMCRSRTGNTVAGHPRLISLDTTLCTSSSRARLASTSGWISSTNSSPCNSDIYAGLPSINDSRMKPKAYWKWQNFISALACENDLASFPHHARFGYAPGIMHLHASYYREHVFSVITLCLLTHPLTFSLSAHLFSLNVPSLTHIQTVQELSNILIPYSARLLDICSRLRHALDGVAGDLDLVLDTFRRLNIHALVHLDSSYNFLAEEVSIPQSVI